MEVIKTKVKIYCPHKSKTFDCEHYKPTDLNHKTPDGKPDPLLQCIHSNYAGRSCPMLKKKIEMCLGKENAEVSLCYPLNPKEVMNIATQTNN